MSKKVFVITMLLCFIFAVNAGAKYDQPLYAYGDLHERTTINVDLNGDKKKEKVSIMLVKPGDKAKSTVLEINGKKALTVARPNATVRIVDLFSKDKYKEILVFTKWYDTCDVYRYMGGKLKKTWTWDSKKITVKQSVEGSFSAPLRDDAAIAFNGDGTISWEFDLRTSNQRTITVEGKFKVDKNGKLHVIANKDFNCFDYGSNGIKAPSAWVAYKYPRQSKNKEAFRLKKGDRYYPKKVRMTKNYTYMQVKNKSGKKGWIIFSSDKMILTR